jgi:UDP-N-acetylmuramoyl-tripeptide--D-alanyl-D-alanine ligase
VHCHSIEDIQTKALELLPHMGTVLVKGSRFMRMERVVQALQNTSTKAATQPHKEASCC